MNATTSRRTPPRPLGAAGGPVARKMDREGIRKAKLDSAPKSARLMLQTTWAKKGRRPAIRSFCLECVGYVSSEVAQCTSVACPLYEYRITG